MGKKQSQFEPGSNQHKKTLKSSSGVPEGVVAPTTALGELIEEMVEHLRTVDGVHELDDDRILTVKHGGVEAGGFETWSNRYGALHRDDGPARTMGGDSLEVEWWENGQMWMQGVDFLGVDQSVLRTAIDRGVMVEFYEDNVGAYADDSQHVLFRGPNGCGDWNVSDETIAWSDGTVQPVHVGTLSTDYFVGLFIKRVGA